MLTTATRYETPPVKFDFSPLSSARWTDVGAGLLSRDLGVAAAMQGQMGARHLRAPREIRLDRIPGQVSRFRLLFVLKGELSFRHGDSNVQMRRWDAAQLPLLSKASEFKFAEGFEALDIVAPAHDARVAAHSLFQSLSGDKDAQAVNRDEPSAYVAGNGPRRYFAYRDLGVAGATDRRIHIHVVRTIEVPSGGTGWHVHTMGQLFIVISGSGVIKVNTPDAIPIHTGDSMCIGAGMKHDVTSFSGDYAVIEMCLPADYDTKDASAP
jgi:mannose-6-phosphate isomerase-like protein (cupin superfamily)